MIKKILARILCCDPADLGNIALHVPVGVINVAVPVALYLVFGWPGALIGSALAVVFGIGFAGYEITEGLKIKDKIYPDIRGWLCGIVLAVALILAIYLSLQC